jgi:formyl-CoA transferase/succinyl-CoA--D-citramalate CoA-transferase
MRRWGVVRDGESLWWPGIARNKRSVAIDLRTDAGRALVRRMAAHVDVVLENFRPGTLEAWGLSFDDLAVANPGLVMVHVSGYGQSGPMAAEAGFGSIGEAMGGIRNLTGSPDRPPSRSGISLGDSLAAMFAVIGTLAALTERDRSGRGQEVDVAIYEAVAALLESTMADHEVAGVTRGRTGSVLPGVAPSNVYPAADGAEVVIAANADSVFARLCDAMGQPGLAADERYADHAARGRNMAELDERIAAWTRTLPAADLLATLADHKVPAGRIFTAPDMLADPQYAAREMVQRLTNRNGVSLPYAGVVPKFSRTPGSLDTPGPALGADTEEALRVLAGVDDGAWAALGADEVVATADPAPAPVEPVGDER